MTAPAAPPAAGNRVLALTDYHRGESAWIDGLLDRLIAKRTPRCRHLRRRPLTVGILYADEGFARCLPCAAKHVGTMPGRPRGAFGAAASDRGQCGGCKRLYLWGRLTVLCLALVPWTLYVGLCSSCETALRAGGESLE